MDVMSSNHIKALLNKAIHECSSSIQEREAAIDEFYKVLKKTKDGVAYGVHLLAEKIADSPEQESLEALDVLDKCMYRCGVVFRSEVNKFRFLNELIKIVSPKYKGLHKSPLVRYRILLSMHHWVKSYQQEYKIKEAYEMLKRQGIIIEDVHGNMSPILSGYNNTNSGSSGNKIITSSSVVPVTVATPSSNVCTNASATNATIFEDDEKSKLLKKLLRSKNPDDLQAANKLIKTMVKEDEKRCELETKRSIELQTVHNNAKLLNEMLDSYCLDGANGANGASSTTTNNELELIKELYQSCERLRPHVFQLASDTQKNEELLNDILEASVALGEVYEKYKRIIIQGCTNTTITTTTLTTSINKQQQQPHTTTTTTTCNNIIDTTDIVDQTTTTTSSLLYNNSYCSDLLQINNITTTTDDLLDLTTPTTTTTTLQSSLLNSNSDDIIELNDIFNNTTTTLNNLLLQPIQQQQQQYNNNKLITNTTTTTTKCNNDDDVSGGGGGDAFKELNLLSEQLLKQNLNQITTTTTTNNNHDLFNIIDTTTSDALTTTTTTSDGNKLLINDLRSNEQQQTIPTTTTSLLSLATTSTTCLEEEDNKDNKDKEQEQEQEQEHVINNSNNDDNNNKLIKEELNKLLLKMNIKDIKCNNLKEPIILYNKNNIEIKLNYTKNNSIINIINNKYQYYCYVITTINKNINKIINNYIFNCIKDNTTNDNNNKYIIKLEEIKNKTTTLYKYEPTFISTTELLNNNYLTQILLITNTSNTTNNINIKLKYMICYTICNADTSDLEEQDLISDTDYIQFNLY